MPPFLPTCHRPSPGRHCRILIAGAAPGGPATARVDLLRPPPSLIPFYCPGFLLQLAALAGGRWSRRPSSSPLSPEEERKGERDEEREMGREEEEEERVSLTDMWDPRGSHDFFIIFYVGLTCGSHGFYYFSGSNCHVSATSMPRRTKTESNWPRRRHVSQNRPQNRRGT